MQYISSVLSIISKPYAVSLRLTGVSTISISTPILLPGIGIINILRASSFISMQIMTNGLALIKQDISFSVIMVSTSVLEECTDWWRAWNFLKCQLISLDTTPSRRWTQVAYLGFSVFRFFARAFNFTSVNTYRTSIMKKENLLTICSNNFHRALLISYGPVTLLILRLVENGIIYV